MAWFYYKLGVGNNGNRIHIPIAKIQQGYWDKSGFFRLTGCTLTVNQKDSSPKVFVLENKGILALHADELKKIADEYFGGEKVDEIWWRGGFRAVGKKLVWYGRKKLHAREVTRFVGITRKVWERNSFHSDSN